MAGEDKEGTGRVTKVTGAWAFGGERQGAGRSGPWGRTDLGMGSSQREGEGGHGREGPLSPPANTLSRSQQKLQTLGNQDPGLCSGKTHELMPVRPRPALRSLTLAEQEARFLLPEQRCCLRTAGPGPLGQGVRLGLAWPLPPFQLEAGIPHGRSPLSPGYRPLPSAGETPSLRCGP